MAVFAQAETVEEVVQPIPAADDDFPAVEVFSIVISLAALVLAGISFWRSTQADRRAGLRINVVRDDDGEKVVVIVNGGPADAQSVRFEFLETEGLDVIGGDPGEFDLVEGESHRFPLRTTFASPMIYGFRLAWDDGRRSRQERKGRLSLL